MKDVNSEDRLIFALDVPEINQAKDRIEANDYAVDEGGIATAAESKIEDEETLVDDTAELRNLMIMKQQ